MLFNQILFGPISQGASRYFAPARESGELANYLVVIRRLVLIATGLSVVLLLLAMGGLAATGVGRWPTIMLAAFLFAILNGYNSLLTGIQNAARQRSIVALHQGAAAWIKVLAAALLVMLLGGSSIAALYGYALATLLVLGSQLAFARKLFRNVECTSTRKSEWKSQIRGYSWPFAVWGGFVWAQSVSDRWALALFQTQGDIGLYAILFQVGYQPITLATGVAVQFVAPVLFQKSGDAKNSERNATVSRLTLWLTWLALGLTACSVFLAFLFHEQVFRLLVAPEFRAVSQFFPWMLLAGGIFAAGQLMSLKLLSMMKTRTLMPAKIVTAVAGIILNFVGAYWFGIAGIVAAMVIFAIGFTCWSTILFVRERSHS